MSSSQSVRVIKLPADRRYWNQHILKVRAILSTNNFSATVRKPHPHDETRDEKVDVTTDFIFDYKSRPSWISRSIWKQVSRYVYATFLLGIPDELKYLMADVPPGDGSAAISSLRQNIGTVSQQK